MTPEDLEQIRAVIREEIAVSEERTTAAIASAIAASEERTTAAIASAIAVSEERTASTIANSELRLTGCQERAVESIASEFSELREEMSRRFDHVNKRFDSVDRRLERVENQYHYLTLQSAGMSKSLTEAERLDTATFATLAAQQKAIDDLYHQVAELKRQRPQQQQ
jgi:hypothetical protein